MIYTRFGSPIEIISLDKKTNLLTIRRIEDEKEFFANPRELKADDGTEEINKAIKLVTPTNLTEIGF